MKKLIKSLSVCLVILFGISSVNAATLTDRLKDGHKLRLGFGTAVHGLMLEIMVKHLVSLI